MPERVCTEVCTVRAYSAGPGNRDTVHDMADLIPYEALLGELLGLVGRNVAVSINVELERGEPLVPVAIFTGRLRSARDTDMSSLEGIPLPQFPGGESMLFYVGDDANNPSCFVVRRDDCELGHRTEEGLAFMVGNVRLGIFESADDTEARPEPAV